MYKLGNFTIILSNYNCDRNCPFCIAKNNKKFNGEDENFETLNEILVLLRKNNIKFERFVLSGNGEPSLYDMVELEKYAKIIKSNSDLFDTLRVHTSGNIFMVPEKFRLFNELVPNVEFDILRLAIDTNRDMAVLKYKSDYTNTDEFKKAKKIKFDIGLTKILETDTLLGVLDDLLFNNTNIDLIRFKNLMSGENGESIQAKWVRDNRMNKETFLNLSKNIMNYCKCEGFDNLRAKNGTKIVFENSGNYPKDIVYNNGVMKDYSEKIIDISALKQMSAVVDNTKKSDYNYTR